MIITVFRSRLLPGVDTEYGELASEMSQLAVSMPGFISEKMFVADDGERVTIVLFAGSSQRAWRDHPAHRRPQERGCEALYSEHSLYSATVTYSSSHRGDAIS
ncbi:MAG: antibiotic biosynthesis monooxygenase family protein [Actinomycetota bacterium]